MSASAEAAPDPAGDPASPLPGVGEGNPPGGDVVVQYVVLRRDLIDTWPLGSVVAQGFHHHPDVLACCTDRNLDSMHKMKGETQLRNLANKLKKEGIDHKLWVEQPEDFLTCIATRPYPKSQKTETALYVKKSHNRTIQVNPRRSRGASAVG
nr:PREDICTED: putative peptidyl-tRNA hydrolase PTRHD1 isoform X1 [Musa acuminata subsp. malaccensis]